MAVSGTYTFDDLTITTAGTQISSQKLGFAGAQSARFHVRLVYGGGSGATCQAFIQTSLDQGQSYFDISNTLFGTVAARAIWSVSTHQALTTPIPGTDGTLATDTYINGILGDRFRLKVISTGTYSGGTMVSARMTVSA